MSQALSTFPRKALSRAGIGLALSLLLLNSAKADWLVPGDKLRVFYGPKAFHFSGEDEARQHLVSVELLTSRWTIWRADRTQIGLVFFRNSFGQPCQYVNMGQEWDLWTFGSAQTFVNVTAGLIHGYKEPHQDAIPFNSTGIAPLIIPSAGVRWGSFSLAASVLGIRGLLFSAGWTFDLK